MGRLIRELARDVLGEKKSELVWKRVDIIGDIAVIKMPIHGMVSVEELRLVAERLVERLPYVKSVWLQTGAVGGVYRVRGGLVHLAGERRTVTIYREHGCKFKVDISKVFVTPRLSYEHMRVARLVRPGERILNMFAGVGIFSIVIARHSKPSKIFSIDINPEAYKLMVENVKLNRVEGVVEPILGDAAKVVEERLKESSDRVLMPLPALALDYLPHALKALREGKGWIHVYLHIKHSKDKSHLKEAVKHVESRVEREGWKLMQAKPRAVRSVGPRMMQVVVDAEVAKA
ncbi:MAG: class I SAM-dependent methyltransferase family protein [Desulfurococcales archaeon]|nr:class I SAM-dependent methyltransferase family protein [Desulfurococcales archaeon]